MPGPNQFTASISQIAEIDALLRQPKTVITPRPRKRLSVLRALIQRVPDRTIAREHSISAEGLRLIKLEIGSDGIENVISRLRSVVVKKTEISALPKRRPGAPSATSLRKTISDRKVGTESIVSLASLVLAADVQLAVIAVQAHRRRPGTQPPKRDPVSILGSEVFKDVLSIAREPMNPHWTRGRIDERIQVPFIFLPTVESLKNFSNARRECFPALSRRFSDHWGFIVIASGVAAALERALAHLTRDRKYVIVNTRARPLVAHLEAVLHTLRISLNLRGLLTALEGLPDSGKSWRERSEKCPPFAWHTTEDQAVDGLKDRIVDFHIRAACGYLLDLTSHARQFIPVRDTFSLMPVSTTPKIEPISQLPQDADVFDYAPFPEFEMSFGPEPKRTREEIRRILDKEKSSAKFEYAVRLKPNQRAWLRFPHELLASKKVAQGFPREIGVVSLPRQFVFPAPTQSAGALIKSGHEFVRPRRVVATVKLNDQPCLVFLSKKLIGAIRDAFAENRYGERVSKINFDEAWWRHRLSGPLKVSQADNFGPVGHLFDPPFHFSEAELCGANVTDDTLRRLNCTDIPQFAETSSGLEEQGPTCLFPGYRREESFRKMFVTYDADFLLREISDANWAGLKREADQWRREIGGIVEVEFFAKGGGEKEMFLKVVHPEFKSSAYKCQADFPNWADKARADFENSGRVLRRALENAQRLILSGAEPVAAVAIPHAEILRNWKSFLGQAIRGKLEKELLESKYGDHDATEERSEETDPGECLARDEELTKVRQLLEAIQAKGARDAEAGRLVSLAVVTTSQVWSEAIREIREKGGTRKYQSAITKSLELARSDPSDKESVRAKITKILNRARG